MPPDQPPPLEPQLDDAVERIGGTRKYRSLARETIRDVVRHELRRAAGQRPAAALATAREALHRVAAYYLGEPDYGRALAALEAAQGDPAALESACRGILERHVSTRERLPVMAELYAAVFARTGTPASVADLASACNPFAFRWMGLDRAVRYRAYDINAEMVSLVARYFRIEGIAGSAELRDILCSPPEERADVALLLKMYHCLEHRRRGAGWEVVSRVPARSVVISFPSRNMRGRAADIAGNYRSEIVDRAAAAGWTTEELGFEGEIVILLRKGDS
jgi:16S rRNA (guanine(1405)-N(7))-methyltransferase